MDGQIRCQNGYVWTWKFLTPEINSCGFILHPDTCGGGLNERLDGLPPSEPFLSGIQAYGQAPQRAYPSQVYINANCANDTDVKTRPKRTTVVIFRDTM